MNTKRFLYFRPERYQVDTIYSSNPARSQLSTQTRLIEKNGLEALTSSLKTSNPQSKKCFAVNKSTSDFWTSGSIPGHTGISSKSACQCEVGSLAKHSCKTWSVTFTRKLLSCIRHKHYRRKLAKNACETWSVTFVRKVLSCVRHKHGRLKLYGITRKTTHSVRRFSQPIIPAAGTAKTPSLAVCGLILVENLGPETHPRGCVILLPMVYCLRYMAASLLSHVEGKPAD